MILSCYIYDLRRHLNIFSFIRSFAFYEWPGGGSPRLIAVKDCTIQFIFVDDFFWWWLGIKIDFDSRFLPVPSPALPFSICCAMCEDKDVWELQRQRQRCMAWMSNREVEKGSAGDGTGGNLESKFIFIPNHHQQKSPSLSCWIVRIFKSTT